MPRVEVPGVRVLVAVEKHCRRYWVIENDQQLGLAALAILKGRHKDGYWYLKPEEPKKPSMTAAQVEALPAGRVRDAANEELRIYQREQRWFERESQQYADIQKAIKTKDGALAWQILKARRDYEYEELHLEQTESW